MQDLHEVIDGEWVWFQQVLIDSDITLQKHKEKFRSNLVVSSEDLKKKIQAAVVEFHRTGLPLTDTHTYKNHEI